MLPIFLGALSVYYFGFLPTYAIFITTYAILQNAENPIITKKSA